jgi:hypothetical protein
VPGASLRLVQRWPSYVIEMGDTTLAFERTVAQSIEVDLHDAASSQQPVASK